MTRGTPILGPPQFFNNIKPGINKPQTAFYLGVYHLRSFKYHIILSMGSTPLVDKPWAIIRSCSSQSSRLNMFQPDAAFPRVAASSASSSSFNSGAPLPP